VIADFGMDRGRPTRKIAHLSTIDREFHDVVTFPGCRAAPPGAHDRSCLVSTMPDRTPGMVTNLLQLAARPVRPLVRQGVDFSGL
jgi:hypothetical protein